MIAPGLGSVGEIFPPLSAMPVLVTSTPNVLAQTFYVLEAQTYLSGTATALVYDLGVGAAPVGGLARLGYAQPSTNQLLASDVGYVGNGSPYPPTLSTAFSMDLQVTLDPHSTAGGSQYGSVELENTDGRYNALAASQNNNGRAIRVLTGAKPFDPSRGLFVDPPYASLLPVWGGIGLPWTISDTTFTLPVRDPSYWIEGPIQTQLYGGTGGLDGNAALAGLPKPKTRGGTSVNPVQNVTPVQVDPANLIYQYSDAPGTVVTMYEGGAANYTRDADVPNLYAGAGPAAGHYRTCNALGLFQLGSKPTQAITADVTGSFMVAGAVTTLFQIVRYLILEDMGLPAALLDAGAFIGADAAYQYTAGVFVGATATDGASVVSGALGSIGAQLVPNVNGQLRPFILRAVSSPAGVYFDASKVISVTPVDMPTTLYPPTYRWRVAYSKNYTQQTSGLLALATSARQQYIAQASQFAVWADTSVTAAWLRPTDPDPLDGCLLSGSDAQAVANALGALWGVRRRLYDLVVPFSLGCGRQIGDVVVLTWALDDLGAGRVGTVVGVSFRSYDPTVTLRVII